MSEEEDKFQAALYALSEYDDDTIQHANEAFFHLEEWEWEEALPHLEKACEGRYGHSYYDLALHFLGEDATEEEKQRAASLLLKATIRNIESQYDFGDIENVLKRAGTNLRENHMDLTINFLWDKYENTDYPEPIADAIREIAQMMK